MAPDDDAGIDEEQLVLGDLLNHVLDKGVVITGTVTISVADIDLLMLDLRLLLTSIETAIRQRRQPNADTARLAAGRTMTTHLYCVLPDDTGDAIPPGLSGLAGARVRALPVDGLVAWVSDVARDVPVSIDEVRAHDAVVEAALETGSTPVPARYGQRFDDDDACRAALANRADSVESLVADMQGFVEMTLIVTPSTRRAICFRRWSCSADRPAAPSTRPAAHAATAHVPPARRPAGRARRPACAWAGALGCTGRRRAPAGSPAP